MENDNLLLQHTKEISKMKDVYAEISTQLAEFKVDHRYLTGKVDKILVSVEKLTELSSGALELSRDVVSMGNRLNLLEKQSAEFSSTFKELARAENNRRERNKTIWGFIDKHWWKLGLLVGALGGMFWEALRLDPGVLFGK